MYCTIEITLIPDGCGLEIDYDDGNKIYSIGNQNVDISATNSCGSGDDCVQVPDDVRINGDIPPVEVCDGEEVVVTLETDCYCNGPTVTCEVNTPLFVTSTFKNGKLKFSLSKDNKLQRLKNRMKIKESLKRKAKLMLGSNHEKYDKALDIHNINLKHRKNNDFWTEHAEDEKENIKVVFALEEEFFGDQVSIYVIDTNQSILDNVPQKPYLTKSNVSTLDIQPYSEYSDILNNNAIYLSDYSRHILTDYIGIASADWGNKYPHIYNLNQLHNIYELLDPKIILVPSLTPVKWAEHSEFFYPGINKYLEELAQRTNLELDISRAFFDNNFICHRDVYEEYLDFWEKCFEYLDHQHGLEFDFSGCPHVVRAS